MLWLSHSLSSAAQSLLSRPVTQGASGGCFSLSGKAASESEYTSLFSEVTVSLLALTAPHCPERVKNKVLSRIRSFSFFFCGGLVGALVAPRGFLLCCGSLIPCLLLLNLCCLGLSLRGFLEHRVSLSGEAASESEYTSLSEVTVSLLALTAPHCPERLKNKVLSRIRSFSLFFCGGLVGALVAPRGFLLCCGCLIPCLLLLDLCCLGLSFRGPLEAVFLSLRRSRFRI